MEYTSFTEEEVLAYENKVSDKPGFKPNHAKIKTLARTDPTIFAKYYLGITPFLYQDVVLNDLAKRIQICSSRQIGKTYVVVIWALHYAMYHPNEEVLIFSKSSKQAKKFMRQMKKLIWDGQIKANRRDSKPKGPFSLDEEPAWILPEDIDEKKTNNVEEFSLTNGTVVRSLPPTDSSRGYTGNLVIVDEAAFVPDEVFNEIIEPTVRFTGGTIILLSTPKGQSGFFYEFFDPEETKEKHEYKRYWWNWEICPNEFIKETTLRKQETLDPLTFAQEYEAKFTSEADAFFSAKKIKEATLYNKAYVLSCLDRPCKCGVDFGVSRARTVVSIATIGDSGDIELIYQREFPAGYNNSNLLPFFEQLETQFQIDEYIMDDCPAGNDVITAMENRGKNVYRLSFRREKEVAFFRFRSGVYRRDDDRDPNAIPRIRFPDDKNLITQMYGMQIKSHRLGGFSIEKVSGGYDDRVDSFVMACYPYTREKPKEFRSFIV